MTKKATGTGFMVRAKQTGFLGALRYVGDEFVCPDEDAFADVWMERLTPKEAAEAASKPAQGSDLGFSVKHVPAGNWAVVNKDGERVSTVFKKEDGNAKELALAEAVRLNAGGQPVMPGPTGGGPKPAPIEEDEEKEDPSLPDA